VAGSDEASSAQKEVHGDSGGKKPNERLTLAEYLRLGRRQQRLYRLSRHPIVSHLILPPAVFLLLYRIPFDVAGS
jgi:acyl-lipid omega-6 desaturase (Delta-12 desaturase)